MASLWNYRVVRIRGEVNGVPWANYVIRSAYYPAGSEPDSVPTSIGDVNVYLAGDTLDDLRSGIAKIHRALSMPVVDESELPNA